VVTTILPPAPDQVGGIFQAVPPEVRTAWHAHQPYVGRTLACGEAEPYVATLIALQRTVKHHGRRLGCFPIDGYLIGFCGEPYDPKWTLVPDRSPIRREDRP
jgi:hypothetical protein